MTEINQKTIYKTWVHGFGNAKEEEEMNWVYAPVPVISTTCSQFTQS